MARCAEQLKTETKNNRQRRERARKEWVEQKRRGREKKKGKAEPFLEWPPLPGPVEVGRRWA